MGDLSLVAIDPCILREQCLLLRAKGGEVRTNAKVVSLEENEGRVSGVRLASGESLRADLVIVGVGMDAAVEPLAGAVPGVERVEENREPLAAG